MQGGVEGRIAIELSKIAPVPCEDELDELDQTTAPLEAEARRILRSSQYFVDHGDQCVSFLPRKGLEIVEPSQTSLDSAARRLITKLFGISKSLIKDLESIGVVSETTDTDTIHESSVNIFSLHAIGRGRIKWVEDLTSHLAFDRQSRTLSMFSLPTFCVSSILRTQEVKILQQ